MITRDMLRLLSLMLLVALAGCASANPPANPKYVDAGFKSATITSLLFVTIADVRRDKADTFTVQAFMEDSGFRWRYVKILKDRGYTLTFSKDFGQVRPMTEDDITAADPAWIDSLGSTEAQWLFLVGVQSLRHRSSSSRAAGAECLGAVVDRSAGRVVWRHEAAWDFGTPGPLSYILYSEQSMAAYAMYGCIHALVQHLPSR